MDELYDTMRRLLALCTSDFRRYLYPGIQWDDRMLALVGPRGVGKTTLFLQRIKDLGSPDEALYVTADHLYFASHSLYETAGAFERMGGRYLFVDEVHKYPNWSRELKMVYDSYPDLHVYITGSSVLDIERGEADLSRRVPVYHMQGLSFREFLAIRRSIEIAPLSLDEIVANRASLPGISHPLPLFQEYLRNGYYPFGSDPDFALELDQVIARTLEVDIPQYANLSVATGRKLKRLLSVTSTLVPFKPNLTSLGSQIGASRNSVEDYLAYLEKAGMIALLRTGAQGLGALGKPDKVYLDNPNILYALAGDQAKRGTMRETFFFNQARVRQDVRASKTSDFEIGDHTFEVGGRNKTFEQLADTPNGYVVKDDIEYGHGRVVPLWAFGLNY